MTLDLSLDGPSSDVPVTLLVPSTKYQYIHTVLSYEHI